MQGCGKLLFPWTKKYKLPGNTYCCEECFKRDFELLATKSDEEKGNLTFTTTEENDGIETDTYIDD